MKALPRFSVRFQVQAHEPVDTSSLFPTAYDKTLSLSLATDTGGAGGLRDWKITLRYEACLIRFTDTVHQCFGPSTVHLKYRKGSVYKRHYFCLFVF